MKALHVHIRCKKRWFFNFLLTAASLVSMMAQPRDVLWIGGLQPSHSVFRSSKDKFADDYQINTILIGQNYFPEQGVDAAVSALNPLVNNGSNVLGVAHDYSGIILRKLQLENSKIGAMILNGVPNKGSKVIEKAIDNEGNSANQTSMEKLIEAINNIKLDDNCQDCNVVGAFISFVHELENLREALLYVTPDGPVSSLATPTVPTAVLWGDHEQGSSEKFLYSLLSSRADPLPSTSDDVYGNCVRMRRMDGYKKAKDLFQLNILNSVFNYYSNMFKAVRDFIAGGGTDVNSYVSSYIQNSSSAILGNIENIRRRSEELARLLRCELANQTLAARYAIIISAGEIAQSEISIPNPQALMACYMDCLAQGNNTSYCNSFCDPQYVTQQQIPLWEFAPNDGLYSKDEQLLDGATVTIRLAGVNHFDEPKWAHPTVRQVYEDLFNGSAGPAFVIPPK